MWVARDKNGKLQVYKEKPVRVSIKTDKLNDEDKEFWDEEEVFDGYDKWIHPEDYFEIDRKLFPDLKWEDEPVEVCLYETDPTYKIKCKHCNKEIKYKRKDIRTDRNYQPSSGYEDEWEYIICPECGEYIVIENL